MSLPEGWRETILDEFISIKHGFAFKGEFISETNNGKVLVTPGNFKIGGGFKSDKFKYYSSDIPEDYILKSNDIMVTMTDLSKTGDTLGFPAKVPTSENIIYLHNQRIGLIEFKNDLINKEFLYWLMRTRNYQKTIVNSSTGSTVRHTSPSRIAECEITIPTDKEEQKAIANILSSFDDKIELLKEQNETLEQMAQGVFREWFVDGADESWEVKTLGEVTNIKGGATPSTKNKDFWNGDIHWTSPKDLSNSKSVFLLDTNKKITKAGLKKISSGLLPKGTLLLSSRAPIGYLAISNVDIAINQGYIALLDDAYFSNYYMYFWLKTHMRLVEGASNGSTFQEISKSAFRQIECIVPQKENIEKFDGFVIPIFDKLLLNIEEIKTLQKTRDTLLPKLMSGEVRVGGDCYRTN